MQNQTHNKLAIITKPLATVAMSLVTAIIIGGFSYLWATNANLASIESRLEQTQAELKRISISNIDVRVSVLEQSVKNQTSIMDKMDAKIDKLLERK